MPITAALIAGGVGLGTGMIQAQQQNKNNQANMLANAAATRYSPWTGIKPQLGGAQGADVGGAALGGAMQGALGGYMQGKNIEQTDASNSAINKLAEAQANEAAMNALKTQNDMFMSGQSVSPAKQQPATVGGGLNANLWERVPKQGFYTS